MNIELEIIELLKKHSLSEFADLETHNLEQVNERVYHLHNDRGSFFLKWIPNDDTNGINEIWINREILAKANIPAPQLIFVSETEKSTLACWEYLDGLDLRYYHRELLPKAFSKLGEFHAAQRHNKYVNSPTTQQAFATIDEMLAAEVEFLCSFYDNSAKAQCASIFSLLDAGYPTFIHGDMHPGNILSTPKELKFVDWGDCISSLNLFDLDYIQSIPLQSSETAWWIIVPSEAEKILPVYFEACGLGEFNYKKIHRAVMLWSELRSHYNSIKNNNKIGAEICRQNIELLIQTTYTPSHKPTPSVTPPLGNAS
jgi:hypothetical protein